MWTEIDSQQVEKKGFDSDVSMYYHAVTLQTAQDQKIQALLNQAEKETIDVHNRAQLIDSIITELLHLKDEEKDLLDLSHLQEKINEYQNTFHDQTGFSDPFNFLYNRNIQEVPRDDVDTCISHLQRVLQRDADNLNYKMQRNTFEMHVYNLITEMLSKQNRHSTTMIKNQLTR